MFDLDEMSHWDEVLERLAHHDPEPQTAELQEVPTERPAPLRELEDA